MFLKTFLMKKKKKSGGRGGDVDVLKHHHQVQFVKTPQSGSLQEGGILRFGPTVKSL